jgi:threonine dehydrogenase-like Zn-dependent dehydrogenase
MGARVIALDPSLERRIMAEMIRGVVVLDPASVDPVAAIRELTHGEGADVTLECSGHPDARVSCARAARPWGKACYVGAHGTATFEMTPDVIHRQLTMLGCWTFNPLLMAECARFAVDRQVDLRRPITHLFRLEDAEEAYQQVEARRIGKGLFIPVGEPIDSLRSSPS